MIVPVEPVNATVCTVVCEPTFSTICRDDATARFTPSDTDASSSW